MFFSRWWWLGRPASYRVRVPPPLSALCSGCFFCLPACCPFSWSPGWCAGICLPAIVVVSACMWVWAVGLMKRRKKKPARSVSNPLERLLAGPKRSAHKIRQDASLRDTYRCRRAIRFNGMVGYASSLVQLHSVWTGPPQSP